MSETSSLETVATPEHVQQIKTKRVFLLLAHIKQYPMLWLGLFILLFWGLVVIFAPVIAPYDPLEQALADRLHAPSLKHIFGTDELGRDVFSRVVYGAQISLPASFTVVLISVVVGSLLGAMGGFLGGITDNVVMRLADVTLAFPSVVLALAISAFLGPSLTNAAIAACIVLWPAYARLMRSQVLIIRSSDYVVAARSLGTREHEILLRHILPNSWTPIIITAALDIGSIILLVSALSFLGLGVSPPTPEWGAMISLGRTKFYQWWLATFPGLAILLVILAANLVSEGLREWLDPNA